MEKKKQDINMRLIIIGVCVVLLIIAVIALKPFFVLQETEVAIITQFGNPIREVSNAGIHFKIPLLDQVNRLPKLILEWDGEIKQFATYDKRMVLIDTTVRWKIINPTEFYIRNTSIRKAQKRLDDILESDTQKVITQHTLEELTRSTNRVKELNAETKSLLSEQGITEEDLDLFPLIEVGRADIEDDIKERVFDSLKEVGVEMITFNIKKVFYVEVNLDSVYGSMIAERKKIAQKFRSEGELQRKTIMGQIEEVEQTKLGQAQMEALKIKGEADSEAARQYNEAYNKNASTRDFYQFIKKMEVYSNTPENASLIISTDSDFFDFFKEYK